MMLFQLDVNEYKTLAVCLTAITAFMILFQVSMPFNKIRIALFVTMVTAMTLGVTCFTNISLFNIGNLFNFAIFTPKILIIIGVLTLISLGIFILITLPMKRIFDNINDRFKGKSFRPKNT